MPLLTARTLKYSEHTICYHCVPKTSAQRHYISREPRNDVTYPDLPIGVGKCVPVSEIEVCTTRRTLDNGSLLYSYWEGKHKPVHPAFKATRPQNSQQTSM